MAAKPGKFPVEMKLNNISEELRQFSSILECLKVSRECQAGLSTCLTVGITFKIGVWRCERLQVHLRRQKHSLRQVYGARALRRGNGQLNQAIDLESEPRSVRCPASGSLGKCPNMRRASNDFDTMTQVRKFPSHHPISLPLHLLHHSLLLFACQNVLILSKRPIPRRGRHHRSNDFCKQGNVRQCDSSWPLKANHQGLELPAGTERERMSVCPE